MANPNSSSWPSAIPSFDHSGANNLTPNFVPATLPAPTTKRRAQEAPFSTFTSPTASKPAAYVPANILTP